MLGVLALTGCSGGDDFDGGGGREAASGETPGPGEVVEQFTTAYAEGDCERAASFFYFRGVAEDEEEFVQQCEQAPEEDREVTRGASVVGETDLTEDEDRAFEQDIEEGDNDAPLPEPFGENQFARVEVDSAEQDGESVPLVLVDGDWKMLYDLN